MTKPLSPEEKARRKAERDALKLTPEQKLAKRREYARKWRSENKEHLSEYFRNYKAVWNQENRDRIRELTSIRYHAEPDKYRERCRDYYSRTKPHQLARMADWKNRNPTAYALRIITRTTGIAASRVPVTLIEAKVAHLDVARKVKELSK